MTLQAKSFGSKCVFSDKFTTSLMKCGVVEAVLAWAKFKQQAQLQSKCAGKKHTKIKGKTYFSSVTVLLQQIITKSYGFGHLNFSLPFVTEGILTSVVQISSSHNLVLFNSKMTFIPNSSCTVVLTK